MAAKKISSVYTELRARLDKYEKDLNRAKGVTNKAATNMQRSVNKLSFDKAAASLTKFLGAFASLYGIKMFTGFMLENIELAASWERGLLRTEALIKSTGGAAGFSAQQLTDFAVEMDRATLFDKRGMIDAINVMQTFRKISGDTFKQAIRLSADLAEINQTSVKASSMQLAKILEAPDRLLSSLTRSGIIFDKSQEDLIKSLVKSNRLIEAQKIILQKLQSEIGGAATGASGGVAGKIDLLKHTWGEFRESLSDSELAVKGIEAINLALERLTDKIKSGELLKWSKYIWDNIIPLGVIANRFDQAKDLWGNYFQYFADLENKIVRKKVPEGQKTIITKKAPSRPPALSAAKDAALSAAEAEQRHLEKIKKLNDEYIAILPTIKTYRDSWEVKGERTFTDQQIEKSEQLKSAFDSLQSKAINDDLEKAFEGVGESATEAFDSMI